MPTRDVPIFTTTRSRWGVILLVAYQAFFLNVVIPAHTRGMVTWMGRSAAAGLQDAACRCCCPRQRHAPGTPTPQDRQTCAICRVASHYMPATVLTLRLSEFGPVELLPAPPPATVERSGFRPTYYACGPPAA